VAWCSIFWLLIVLSECWYHLATSIRCLFVNENSFAILDNICLSKRNGAQAWAETHPVRFFFWASSRPVGPLSPVNLVGHNRLGRGVGKAERRQSTHKISHTSKEIVPLLVWTQAWSLGRGEGGGRPTQPTHVCPILLDMKLPIWHFLHFLHFNLNQ